MSDPREIAPNDLYQNITPDKEDARRIELELEKIENVKRDLLERLHRKKIEIERRDPNFTGVQVPASPVKKHELQLVEQKDQKLKNINRFEESNENPNELCLQQRFQKQTARLNDSNASTEYFMEKFRDAKRKEKVHIEKHESMMKSRVHTFNGIEPKNEYQHVIVDELEQYSNLWINKRYTPVSNLKSMLHEVKILRLNKLFAKVRPPKFEEPQYSNWVVVGIVSDKSDIKFTASNKPQKYLKFTLTDFKHKVDTYIFGKEGVERYYNLRIGDIIAVLNPEILPWRPSGKQNYIKSFNLRISHPYKCILEIGKSRDLARCPIVVRSTSKECGVPINKKVDRCCEYHREMEIRKGPSKRLDLSGQYALGAPTKLESQPALYRGHTAQNVKIQNFKLTPSYSQNNPHLIDKYGEKSKFFSNRNAAKAFFDDEFQNPDMISNLDNKRRKIMEQRKSNVLNRELDRLLRKDQDLEGKTREEVEKMKQTTQRTLQSGLFQKVGFDPTGGKISRILKNKERSKDGEPKFLSQKDRTVDDLMAFKKEYIILAPSKVDLLNKKNKREKVWQENFGQNKSNDNSESDSDLEIV
ncbi:hypothetical protein KAFR_0D02210 [Kazachstania africana CBS 2517]|uniref:Uncharacterized protein n=1 Tax=Kazachstania africana (strain ATCC 22294 / BCRC 22015 / CBS 2517 / CECT 1963 / NBRC 1671 / NRRL Y-8276) TaxID=1071382 RepID=H2AU18_KAZAF|nr:hypothetical protein KAFR_0D02210 [Kazachstania africana CBS 2517]CCF57868.1 hypothetical protein KAFR_0D02210 [Kazachstania africana CBS 2517]